jgi:hypothetical protein
LSLMKRSNPLRELAHRRKPNSDKLT